MSYSSASFCALMAYLVAITQFPLTSQFFLKDLGSDVFVCMFPSDKTVNIQKYRDGI